MRSTRVDCVVVDCAVDWQHTLEPQGSLHYTPEHCLVNGGVPVSCWKKPCFKMVAKCIFQGALNLSTGFAATLELLRAGFEPGVGVQIWRQALYFAAFRDVVQGVFGGCLCGMCLRDDFIGLFWGCLCG